MKDRSYIERQLEMLLENPRPFQKRALELQARAQEHPGLYGLDVELFGIVHWAETIPFPPELAAERRAYDRLYWWAALLYSAPWLGFGIWGLASMTSDDALWGQWPMLWRGAVAGVFALWHYYAAKLEKFGVWGDLDRWEQALLARERQFRDDCKTVILENGLSMKNPQKN